MRDRKFIGVDISYIVLFFSALITSAVIYAAYTQTQGILKERLREKLVAIVGTAALQLDAKEVNAIKDENDINKPELRDVISKMKNIRDVNKNLKYIYIWRKTSDPKNLEFVADAEMLQPIDRDGNGAIEGEEIPPLPGEKYAVDQIPNLAEAFLRPIAQEDFIVDKWGTFLSGLAPIRDSNGDVVALLGVDVEVGDFYKVIQATLTPFVLLAVALFTLLSIQTISLVRIWQSRLDIVKELDRQKDELLSIVSHQLATPIASVKWYIEMILDGDLGAINDEQRKQLETVMHSSQNLSDLVGMILDVSRIQLGRVKIEKQPLELNQFFSEILEVVEPKAVERHVNLVKSIPTNLPEAMLDRRYTRMTIENLMTNAIKYTPENGRVDVTVTIDGKWLHIVVKDTGCGIPVTDQKQIFGKMYRASNVRNSAIDGNGFGLYVAKGAVESQGGEIWFQSSEGKGTTFFVKLPLKDASKS